MLYLCGNKISDLSPLASLTNLTALHLWGNQISDLSPLSDLTNLRELYLPGNNISDLSPLVENSGLGSGDEIWLGDNNLDLSEGSEDIDNIRALEDMGVIVSY
jgi:Leucine-rich repeat (LRR) protein